MLWPPDTASKSKIATRQTPPLCPTQIFQQQSKVVQIGVKICVRKAVNVNLSMRSDRLHPVNISVVSGAALLAELGVEQLTVQGANMWHRLM